MTTVDAMDTVQRILQNSEDSTSTDVDTSDTFLFGLLGFVLFFVCMITLVAFGTHRRSSETRASPNGRNVRSRTSMRAAEARSGTIAQERRDYFLAHFAQHNMDVPVTPAHFNTKEGQNVSSAHMKAPPSSSFLQPATMCSVEITGEMPTQSTDGHDSEDEEIAMPAPATTTEEHDDTQEGLDHVGITQSTHHTTSAEMKAAAGDVEEGGIIQLSESQLDADDDADAVDEACIDDALNAATARVPSNRVSFNVSAHSKPAQQQQSSRFGFLKVDPGSLRSFISLGTTKSQGPALQIRHPIKPEKKLTLSDGSCPICFDAYEVGDDLVASASPNFCSHAFHRDCMIEYLLQLSYRQDVADERKPPGKYVRNLGAPVRKAPCPCCRQDFMYNRNNVKWTPKKAPRPSSVAETVDSQVAEPV